MNDDANASSGGETIGHVSPPPDRLPRATDPLAVTVLGAGRMGTQIGFEYALAGHSVLLLARDRTAVWKRVGQAADLLRQFELVTPESLDDALQHVAVGAELGDVEQVDLVVESLPEDFALKTKLLGALASRFPHMTIASNTSSLSITELGVSVDAGERTIGTHYWNPPLLMPLVEIVTGDSTNATQVEHMTSVLLAMGKRPVHVRDVPGFVWNRLQFALFREALWIVEHGVAAPEVVDEIVRLGLARRLRLTGPFETAALGGIETFEAVARNLFPLLSNADRPSRSARIGVADQTVLDALRARRDEGLAAELRA